MARHPSRMTLFQQSGRVRHPNPPRWFPHHLKPAAAAQVAPRATARSGILSQPAAWRCSHSNAERKQTMDSTPPDRTAAPLADEDLTRMDRWWRAANYLSVGQIYL